MHARAPLKAGAERANPNGWRDLPKHAGVSVAYEIERNDGEDIWSMAYLPYQDEPVRPTMAAGSARNVDAFDEILTRARVA